MDVLESNCHGTKIAPRVGLNHALVNHRIGDLDKSSDVCSLDVIHVARGIRAVGNALRVDVLHNVQ